MIFIDLPDTSDLDSNLSESEEEMPKTLSMY